MKTALFVMSALAFVFGALIFGAANGAIHEIEGFVLCLISAVFFSGAAIVGALNHIGEKLEVTAPQYKDTREYSGTKPAVKKQQALDKPLDLTGLSETDQQFVNEHESILVSLGYRLTGSKDKWAIVRGTMAAYAYSLDSLKEQVENLVEKNKSLLAQ